MQLNDARTGRTVPVDRPRGDVVRVRAAAARRGPDSLTALRIVLVADLIRRVLEELHGLQVWVTLADPGRADRAGERSLARRLGRFWIALPSPHDAAPAGATVISVSDSRPTGGTALVQLRVGPVLGPTPPMPDDDACLAVRFALLNSRYSGPVSLTPEVVDGGRATVERWRHRIREWGEHPSVPMPSEVAARCAAALDRDLDTPNLIGTLTDLEVDPAVPPGAKFETFLHLDRYLAVDLARNLGTAGATDIAVTGG